MVQYRIAIRIYASKKLADFNLAVAQADRRTAKFSGYTVCTCLLLLQQDEVLSELKEYARSDPKPDDAPSVELTIAYLEALNGLFEKSILGQRVRIFDSSGSTIQRMESSFNFFTQWAKERPFDEVDSKQFLSW